MSNEDKKLTFKDFLFEYSFKDVLPPGKQRIYPVHFEQDELVALNNIDNCWLPFRKVGKLPAISSSFTCGKKYKLGTCNKTGKVYIDCYRDRYVINIHFYNDDFTTMAGVIDPIAIPRKNISYFTRRISNIIKQYLF